MVDLPGIEPGPRQCECRALPAELQAHVGALGIEPNLHAPEACVLPVYYAPYNNF